MIAATLLRTHGMFVVKGCRISAPIRMLAQTETSSHRLLFRHMRTACLTSGIALALLTMSPVHADETPGVQDITGLIARLGSDEFADRQHAEEQLLKQGGAAVEALRNEVDSTDVEVRRRVRRVLRDILEAELTARVETFKSDSASEGDDIPGWRRFRDKTGTSDSERNLFVQMIEAEPGLLLSSERGTAVARAALRFRIQKFMQGQNTPVPGQRTTPGVGSLAAMLLVSGDAELVGQAAPTEVTWLRNWLRQNPFKKFVEDKKNGTGGRKLLTHWVLARTNNGAYHVDRLYDALTFKLKEALPLAVQGLKTQPYVGMSIESIGRLGGKEYAALLLPMLDDKTVVASYTTNNKVVEILAKDVALAWLAHLTDQKPKAYGLPQAEAWFNSLKRSNSSGFNSRAYQVDDVKNREKNRKAWDEWVGKHPLPKPPRDFADVKDQGPAPVEKIEEPVEEEWKEPEPFSGPQLADRFELQKLRQARDAIAEKKWFEAARALAELAEIPGEKWFQPERGVSNYRELRSEVERIILALPAAGLAQVEQFSGAIARTRLDKALAESDLAGIRTIAENYFFTRAGADATWQIATMALDSGQPFEALMQLERMVVASRYGESFEPLLSLRRALCHARLQQFEQAAQVLLALRAKFPEFDLSPGFEQVPRSGAATEWIAWLATVSDHAVSTDSGWLMHRGNSVRNLTAAPMIPWLNGDPVSPLTDIKSLRPAINAITQQLQQQRLGRIPSVQPIVTDGRVVYRTTTGLQAVDHKGNVLWSAPQQDSLWEFTRTEKVWALPQPQTAPARSTTVTPGTQIGQAILDGLRERLLDNTVFGTLSSDGQRVFAIETDSFRCPPTIQRLSVASAGELQLETRSGNQRNTLAAYDLETGRLVWQQPAPPQTDSEAGGAGGDELEFLGTPLVAGSSLFVVLRSNDEIRLRQLDPVDGQTTREWMLQTDAPPPRHVFWRSQYPPAPGHRHACSPSYIDGTIVCQTPSNRVVAIDLRTGRLRWSWLGAKRRSTPAQWRFNPWMQIASTAQRDGELDHWCDTSLILDDESVLVTTPESHELVCLNLADGSVKWSTQRHDGLYVAGVQNGRVIVVGRGGARAYDLESGTLAWPAGTVAWPDAAMPAGTGYLDRDRYCVPLNNGEVVVVNTTTGHWVARSRPREESTPGNLVAVGNTVWSLGLSGLQRYSSVEQRVEQLAQQAAAQTDDAQVLADWGEALLNSGQIVEALAPLRQAAGTDQKERARKLLARAISDGVPFDIGQRSQLVRELDLGESSTEELVRLHAETAVGFERQGNLTKAIESLLKIAELPIIRTELSSETPLTYQESVSQTVRIDRWFQSKFARWYPKVPEAVRQSIDDRVASLTESDPDRANMWFDLHQNGGSILLQVAGQFDDDRVKWELALRQASDRDTESAKTAREQLLAGLSTSDTNRAGYANRRNVHDAELTPSPRSPWPRDSVQKSVEKRDPKQKYVQRMLIPIERHDRRLDEPLWLRLNLTERKWAVLDASGRTRYTLDQNNNGKATSYSYSANVAHAKLIGPVLVIWTGMQVTAFHLHDDEGTRLWSKQVYDASNRPWVMRYMPRRVQRAGRRAAVVFGAVGPSTWQAFAATPEFVALQIDRQLIAFDLTTGSVLWKRDGIPLDCDITGDDKVIAAIPSDQDEALIFSAVDGHELARREIPGDDTWISFDGIRLVTHRKEQQKAFVEGLDLATGESVWSHSFTADAHVAPVYSDLTAVLEPDGQFSVIAASSGDVRNSAKLSPVKSLQGLTVFESRGRYIVCARRPDVAAPNGNVMRINTSGTSRGRLQIGGRVTAVDAAGGRIEWQAELPSQTVAPAVLSDVPLAASFYTVQKQVKLANGNLSTTSETWLNVLNLNTGIVAHNAKLSSGAQMDLQFEPREKRVDLDTRSNVLRFRFAVE